MGGGFGRIEYAVKRPPRFMYTCVRVCSPCTYFCVGVHCKESSSRTPPSFSNTQGGFLFRMWLKAGPDQRPLFNTGMVIVLLQLTGCFASWVNYLRKSTHHSPWLLRYTICMAPSIRDTVLCDPAAAVPMHDGIGRVSSPPLGRSPSVGKKWADGWRRNVTTRPPRRLSFCSASCGAARHMRSSRYTHSKWVMHGSTQVTAPGREGGARG